MMGLQNGRLLNSSSQQPQDDPIRLDAIPEALAAIRNGACVVVVDD